MSKILVLGGTGLIGSKVVGIFQASGKQVVVASPSRGVNSVTGEGLAAALKGVDTVIDVSNVPPALLFDPKGVVDFFSTSTSNVVREAKQAGVKHYVVLSIVGVDQVQAIHYMAAKVLQEKIVRESGLPYTIVRATQFYEFLETILQGTTKGQEAHVSDKYVQLIAADDVAFALSYYALISPLNNYVNVAGPHKARMVNIVSRFATDIKDSRKVIADPNAGYFGAQISNYTLTLNAEGTNGHAYRTDYETWFASSKFSKKA